MFLKVILVFVYFNCVFGDDFTIDGPVVKTSSGSVKGLTIDVLNQPIDQFLGIPYAVPPLGSLRFAKPKPITKPIEGIIDATKAKNSCMQSGSFQSSGLKTSEDCLFLNVWSPKPSEILKPVMFWIHGGGLKGGSIFESLYNGSVLATQEMVFVSTNYRLGRFGFLYGGEESAPGNVGLYDQILAMKWVRENIHLFGGDKNQITIFGESAGSRSISVHIISPESRGLFQRAIMESGSILHNKETPMQTKSEALLISKQLAKQMNCTDDKQWLECLRTVDSNEINKAIDYIFIFPLEGTDILPSSVQTAFNHSEYQQDIDILAGVVRNEGSLLAYLSYPRLQHKIPSLSIKDFVVLVQEINSVYHGLNTEDIKKFYLKNRSQNDPDDLRQAIYEMFGDVHVKCPTYLMAKQFAKQTTKGKTYFYEQSYQSKNIETIGCEPKTMGICHGADMEFVFGLPLQYPNRYIETDVQFSKVMMKAWTNFAKTGSPDPKWNTMVDAEGISRIHLLNPMFNGVQLIDPYKDSCEGFWKNYFL